MRVARRGWRARQAREVKRPKLLMAGATQAGLATSPPAKSRWTMQAGLATPQAWARAQAWAQVQRAGHVGGTNRTDPWRLSLA